MRILLSTHRKPTAKPSKTILCVVYKQSTVFTSGFRATNPSSTVLNSRSALGSSSGCLTPASGASLHARTRPCARRTTHHTRVWINQRVRILVARARCGVVVIYPLSQLCECKGVCECKNMWVKFTYIHRQHWLFTGYCHIDLGQIGLQTIWITFLIKWKVHGQI